MQQVIAFVQRFMNGEGQIGITDADMIKVTPNGAEGSYVNGSIFVRVLGSPSRTKIIDVFLGKHYTELSAAQIADLAGIDVSTFHRNVDVLLDIGVVEETRTVSGAQLYQLDTDHPVSKALGKTRWELLGYVENIDRPDADKRADFVGVADEPEADD